MNTTEKMRLLSMTALHAALFLALGLFQIVLVKFWQQATSGLSLTTGALLVGAFVAGFAAMWANMRASVRFIRALKAGVSGRKPHLLAFGLTLFAVLLNSQVWRADIVASTSTSDPLTTAAPTLNPNVSHTQSAPNAPDVQDAPSIASSTPSAPESISAPDAKVLDTMPNSEPN